ncbi:MAG TPA: aldehyde dehydrogenase family protein, partial [Actinomadura sp.]|nr:aldehyde dehydrogenase family protein [Actinomadura sp.]
MTGNNTVTGKDPASIPDTSAAELETTLAAAAAAAGPFAALPPMERAGMLAAVADALEAAGDELVPIAVEESG